MMGRLVRWAISAYLLLIRGFRFSFSPQDCEIAYSLPGTFVVAIRARSDFFWLLITADDPVISIPSDTTLEKIQRL